MSEALSTRHESRIATRAAQRTRCRDRQQRGRGGSCLDRVSPSGARSHLECYAWIVKGYICVFRHAARPASHVRKTAASGHPVVAQFLDRYLESESYLDWGDDPAFFSAQHFLGDLRLATWGVCRPNVRAHAEIGDFIVFFCAKPEHTQQCTHYYYIGIGTIIDKITREQLWNDEAFAPYRQFLNVLARPVGDQLERFEYCYPGHRQDWQKRLRNYILFGGSSTFFNVARPLRVATYSNYLPERWESSESKAVAQLERILFPDNSSRRRLRTSHSRHAHSHLNLRRSQADADLPALRAELLALARTAG